MAEYNKTSAYAKTQVQAARAQSELARIHPILNRKLDRHAPHTHITNDPTHVKFAGRRHYICLLTDLCNRAIAGYSAGARGPSQ